MASNDLGRGLALAQGLVSGISRGRAKRAERAERESRERTRQYEMQRARDKDFWADASTLGKLDAGEAPKVIAQLAQTYGASDRATQMFTRIYVSEQGLNRKLQGLTKDAMAQVELNGTISSATKAEAVTLFKNPAKLAAWASSVYHIEGLDEKAKEEQANLVKLQAEAKAAIQEQEQAAPGGIAFQATQAETARKKAVTAKTRAEIVKGRAATAGALADDYYKIINEAYTRQPTGKAALLSNVRQVSPEATKIKAMADDIAENNPEMLAGQIADSAIELYEATKSKRGVVNRRGITAPGSGRLTSTPGVGGTALSPIQQSAEIEDSDIMADEALKALMKHLPAQDNK